MTYSSSAYWSNKKEIPIVIDSGASKSIIPISSDFIRQFSPMDAPIQGLSSQQRFKALVLSSGSFVIPEEHQHLLIQLLAIFMKQILGYSFHKLFVL